MPEMAGCACAGDVRHAYFFSVLVTLLGTARDVKLSSYPYHIELVGDRPERRGDGASSWAVCLKHKQIRVGVPEATSAETCLRVCCGELRVVEGW